MKLFYIIFLYLHPTTNDILKFSELALIDMSLKVNYASTFSASMLTMNLCAMLAIMMLREKLRQDN